MTNASHVVTRIGRLRLPTLCFITDRHRIGGGSIDDVAAKAAAGGANLVQVREKDMPAGDLFHLVTTVRQATRGRALVIVNDRLDVAQACGADGVHLPENGLSTAIARWLLGPHALIGKSAHTVEAAEEAQKDGADYVQLGTIFESPSKPDAKPAGVALIEEVTKRVTVPVLAIGGITAKNAAQAIEAGASGVSVISDITDAKEPDAAAEALVKAMADVWKGRLADAGAKSA